MKPGEMERLARVGRIDELEKAVDRLGNRIIGLAASARAALFSVGADPAEIDVRLARTHLEDLEKAKGEYEQARVELAELRSG